MKKMGENDIAYLILYVLDKYGELETWELIHYVKTEHTFTGENRKALKDRPGDVAINQIIRNIVSHRTSRNNIIHKKWVEYNGVKLSITALGREQLKNRLL